MLKKILRSPVTTAVLFLLAAGLLLTGTIGGVRAAPLVTTNSFLASMQLSDTVAVQLVENEAFVSDGGELLTALAEDDGFKVGKTYDEVLAVANAGGIAEYVRVTVYRYWTDENGKALDLDPSLIRLNFLTDGGWTIDQAASTPERTVLYYSAVLSPGEVTPAFADAITIDSSVMRLISAEDGDFEYDGVEFHVEAVVDGVQEHNGQEAMTSVWGRTNAG